MSLKLELSICLLHKIEFLIFYQGTIYLDDKNEDRFRDFTDGNLKLQKICFNLLTTGS